MIGRITVSASMSLLSFGENIVITVESIDNKSSIVGIESALKVGVNAAGASRHQKNFNYIISSLSRNLQEKYTQPVITSKIIDLLPSNSSEVDEKPSDDDRTKKYRLMARNRVVANHENIMMVMNSGGDYRQAAIDGEDNEQKFRQTLPEEDRDLYVALYDQERIARGREIADKAQKQKEESQKTAGNSAILLACAAILAIIVITVIGAIASN